jgi:O-antigen/teichoic acid export membrane protein
MFALVMASAVALSSQLGWVTSSAFDAIITTAAAIVFIGLRDCIRRVCFAELKVGWALLVDTVACLIQAGGLLVLVRFHELTVSRTYALLGISSALVAGSWLILHRREIRPGPRVYGRDLVRNWSFAKWLLASTILSQFARYLYPWLLAAFHGTSATGLWAACSAIVALGNPVALGLGNYALPKISSVYASAGITGMAKQVHRSALQFVALLLPIVVVLAGWGGRIVTGLYGKTYSGNSGVIFLLALSTMIGSLMYPYSQALFSMELAKLDTLVNIFSVVVLFTVGVAAVKFYAAFGAAAALVFTYCIAAIIRVGVFAREVSQRMPEGQLIRGTARLDLVTSDTDRSGVGL